MEATRTNFLPHETDQIHYQTPHSAGDVVLNMHTYQLTLNKRKGLRALKKRNLWEKFTALYDFRGLWEGLQLGSMEGHLATHFFEEMGRNLDGIFNCWDDFTLTFRSFELPLIRKR